MRKIASIALIFIFLAAAMWGGFFYWKNLRGIGPALKKAPEDITKLIPPENEPQNVTGLPLKLPAGFSISIFARDLPGARVMAFDPKGDMWVSQTSEGIITKLGVVNGKVARQIPVFSGLRKPHGLAFDTDGATLYFAEENKVSRVATDNNGKPHKLFDLPSGAGHFTRTLLLASDGKLYTSVGSSCNVCIEKNQQRARIFVSDKDGNNLRVFASGLRNSVFLATNPFTKKIWATEMGRDYLGDDAPPDEINIIEDGKNYGWPNCYGKNIHDTDFYKNTYIRNPCMEPYETPSYIDLQAHSAPLGLAFVPNNKEWPEEYTYNLLVAYHGSWNRSTPTGYKVVRIKLDAQGNYLGTEDFITGWLSNGGALGRPVDIIIRPDGTMYVSDDKAGVIYRIVHNIAK